MTEPEPAGITCINCMAVYDPIACRWQCPVCHYKISCCEGEPQ